MKRLVRRFEDELMMVMALSPFWIIALLLLISSTIPVEISKEVLNDNAYFIKYNQALRQVKAEDAKLEKELKELNEDMRKKYGWK